MQLQQTHSINEAVHHLQGLPETMRQEVFHYIDFLRLRFEEKAKPPIKKVKKRQAGTAKGVAIFADDFDEPLDDFKDYR